MLSVLYRFVMRLYLETYGNMLNHEHFAEFVVISIILWYLAGLISSSGLYAYVVFLLVFEAKRPCILR